MNENERVRTRREGKTRSQVFPPGMEKIWCELGDGSYKVAWKYGQREYFKFHVEKHSENGTHMSNVN